MEELQEIKNFFIYERSSDLKATKHVITLLEIIKKQQEDIEYWKTENSLHIRALQQTKST